ncbi:MAG TPA: hypothetical protein VNF02_03095 [Candidatus Limnocylindrales bacterium]|nr:hypothetical protein [Candidatus Limnocylindrales bacterium]
MIRAATMLFAARLGAQSNSSSTANVADPASSGPSSSAAPASAQVTPAANFKGHFLWTEEFDGSTNSEGQVMSVDSSVGYVFSRHFGVDAGIPVYFIRGTSTTSTGGTTTTSNNGLGDAYLQLRLAFANPVLSYKTVLTGTAPTGSSSEGLSTGHPTYDWTNHIDHHFGRLVPFAEAGVGNSIPETFVFNRPFKSYGHDAHFQAGTGFQIADWLGVSASAYDIAPWGTQTIYSRLVAVGGSPIVSSGHGRVFNLANQTTGSSSLAADNGFSAGADISPGSILDFSVSYSHSIHFQLDTVWFGVGVNMSKLLRGTRRGF